MIFLGFFSITSFLLHSIHLISGTPPPSLRRRSSTDTSGEVINYGENEISWDAATGFGGQSQPQTYGGAEGHFFSLVTKLVFDLSKKSYASFWCNWHQNRWLDFLLKVKCNDTYQNNQYFLLHNVASCQNFILWK